MQEEIEAKSCESGEWLTASDNPENFAEYERRAAALADEMSDERVDAGEPVIRRRE